MSDNNCSLSPSSFSNSNFKEGEQSEDEARLLPERFLSYVFHELRTPLTVVHSYAQIALDKLPAQPEFDKLRHIVERMINQGEETVEMIEELLEAMRIPLNRLNLDCTEIELTQLIDTTLEHLPDETRSFITLSLVEPPHHIRVDHPRLERAFVTLIKFALDEQKARAMPPQLFLLCYQNQTDNRLKIELKSPGLQFTAHEQASLFDIYRPIRQTIGDTDSKAGLLDIGLYVAHGTIAAHDGSLHYQSDLPGFVIGLPFLKQSKA